MADLLLTPPRRYIDRSLVVPLRDVWQGEELTVVASIARVGTRRPRRDLTLVEADLYDGTALLRAVWFNQPYRARQLVQGREYALSGKVESFRGKPQMTNPTIDDLSRESLTTGRVVPVYGSIGGVPGWQIRKAVHNALTRSRPIEEPLPEELLGSLNLVSRDEAIATMHFPLSTGSGERARRRLVFDELFRLEIALAVSKQRTQQETSGVSHTSDRHLLDRFLSALPFSLTRAQERAIAEIRGDLVAPHPMHRLLQGEVGSGKTVVALAALLTGVEGSYQGAIMAPTEVLAEQHYLAVRALLTEAGLTPPDDSLFAEGREGSGVTLGLLTSNRSELNSRAMGGATREVVLAAVARGSVDVVVGTHALIQEGMHFANLGIAVVDEQHRFGVHQRVRLKDKARDLDPDLLIMTATPIPRTMAMTLYGDLDVTTIDEMPPGRIPVETFVIGPDRLDEVYRRVRSEVSNGRQAFYVCPLVDESPKVEAAAATTEFERLRSALGDLRLGLIHGQLRPLEKEDVMRAFRSGQIDVLVATTVIEVGIDVPNATLMVIMDAQRFGLSQLHQLRGRVGRGSDPAVCVLVADTGTEEASARIAAMTATTDGFELAETDLRIRGQGTVFGARQSGMSDLRIADLIQDIDILATARREAFALVAKDPGLGHHPRILEEVRALLGKDAEWLSIS